MRIFYSSSVTRGIKRLPPYLQKRILTKLELYASQPDPLQFAEPVSGSGHYRFRVGNYRVFFEVLHDTLWIAAIKRRDEAYR